MRFFSMITFFLALASFGATANSEHEDRYTGYKNLSCVVQLDDPGNVEDFITKKVKGFGKEEADGSWIFYLGLEKIHAYYFKIYHGRPRPVFHNNAEFTITATLRDNELSYTTKFYNYTFWPNKLVNLKTQKRLIDVHGHELKKFEFSNSEARLLDEKVVGGLYVNQDGAKLLSCALRGLRYKHGH